MSWFWKKNKRSMNDKETKEQQHKENQPQEQTPQAKDQQQEKAAAENPNEENPVADDAVEVEVEMDEGDMTLEKAIETIGQLQVELRQVREEAEEAKAQAMRLQADFVNFRKRQEKELSNTVRLANEDLLVKLLPILDNFDRTLSSIEKTDNLTAIKEGISMVDKSMRRQLSKAGLEPIEAKGQEFDSELHEAITTVSVEDEQQKGKVIDEVEKGYKLKDRVIRYAKVVIGE